MVADDFLWLRMGMVAGWLWEAKLLLQVMGKKIGKKNYGCRNEVGWTAGGWTRVFDSYLKRRVMNNTLLGGLL
jgi:hypothetical protein